MSRFRGTTDNYNPGPGRGEEASYGQTLRRVIILPIALATLVAVILVLMVLNLIRSAQWLDHTDQVISQANLCVKLLVDAETGLRGYQITGTPVFLEPQQKAEKEFPVQIQTLKQLASNNPSQLSLLNSLETVASNWSQFASQTIRARQQSGDVQSESLNLRGKGLMDQARSLFAEFDRVEQELRQERVRNVRQIRLLLFGPVPILLVGMGAALGLVVRRHVRGLQSTFRAALAQAEHGRESLRVTLEGIGDAVIATDTESRVTFTNPVAARLCGIEAGQAAGKPLSEIFKILNEQTRQPVENPVTKVLRAGIVIGLANHTVLLRPDGSEIAIADSGAPIRDRDGKVVGVVLVFRDVTQERAAEIAAQRLAAIVESSDDPILGKDLQGIITNWNQAAERVFGYSGTEIVGKPITTIIPPDRREEEQYILARLKRGERIEHLETVRQAKDGRQLQVALTISPIKDSSGTIVGASKILRDITAQKTAQAALRQQAELLDQSYDAVFVWELGGAISYWNKGAQELYGFTPEEAVGKTSHDLLQTQQLSPGPSFTQTLGETGRWEGELNHTTRDGRKIIVESRIRAIRQNARPTVLESARDITSRKQYAEELERKVAERTAELARTNERLREADKLKSEFLSSMSHELRTPLNSILGFTEIVKDEMAGPLNELQKQQLGMAYNSGRHLLNLINDLLDLSRIEAGKTEIFKEWIEPATVIEEVIRTVAPLAARKGLVVASEAELPARVYTDRKKLFQVLLNLVNNAVKFTERGGVKVGGRTEEQNLVLSVTDTGIGIKPENIAMLFEAFRQVEGSAAKRYEGTGLGLYLCKKLVHLLEGEIWVESEVDKGSQFTFRIPLGQNGNQPRQQ